MWAAALDAHPASAEHDEVTIDFGVGHMALPAMWLRARCRCASCREPVSGQRLSSLTDVPARTTVARAVVDGDVLTVEFAPDAHRSLFSASGVLAEWTGSADRRSARSEDAKELFDRERASQTEPVEWSRYLLSDVARLTLLDQVVRLGFGVITDVPRVEGAVLSVVASFGYVRETNYGRLFDVRVEPTPVNLASTARGLDPHTDSPYRDPVPTLQLLHCLESSAEDGRTVLVDGFAAASRLRAEDPEGFAVLASTPVPFAYSDEGTELVAQVPIIERDALGFIRTIRMNDRSMGSPRLADGRLTAFHAAYRRFTELVGDPAWRVELALAPGHCLVFDNTRVLHARTGFDASQRRHLQGCYSDIDGLLSSVATLRRSA